MKYVKRGKGLKLLLLLCMLMAGLLLPGHGVRAKEVIKPSLNADKGTVFLYTEDWLYVRNPYSLPGGLEKISWTSSNPSVLRVKSNSKTGTQCTLLPKKLGKSTVKCKIETTEKTYEMTCEITVKRARPFQKITVGGKNVYKTYKASQTAVITEKSKVKIGLRLNKGWKLTDKEYAMYSSKSQASAVKNIPSGNWVPIGRYGTRVYLTVRNDDNEFFTYTVIINKKIKETAVPRFEKAAHTIYMNTKNNILEVKNFPDGARTSWKSSNTKALKVNQVKGNSRKALLTPRKKGKATITCTVTRKNGTKRTITCKVTVKGKVNPLEKVLIDGNNILGKTKNNYYSMKTKDHSMLVQFYNNGGWDFAEEKYLVYKSPSVYGTEKKITGDGVVPVGEYKTVATAKLKNSSGNTYTFTVELYNSNYQK